MISNISKQHEYYEHQSKNQSPQKILNQNHEFFAFEDHYKSAQEHILVCTKQHIDSALHIKQPQQLKRMESFGLETLRKITKRKNENQNTQTRCCFHLPPHISEFHIHLHCFQLPFINQDKQKRIFGHMARSVDQVVEMLKKKQHKKQQELSFNPQQVEKQLIFATMKPRL